MPDQTTNYRMREKRVTAVRFTGKLDEAIACLRAAKEHGCAVEFRLLRDGEVVVDGTRGDDDFAWYFVFGVGAPHTFSTLDEQAFKAYFEPLCDAAAKEPTDA